MNMRKMAMPGSTLLMVAALGLAGTLVSVTAENLSAAPTQAQGDNPQLRLNDPDREGPSAMSVYVRPNVDQSPLRLFVHNPSTKTRTVAVELMVNRTPVEGGKAVLTVEPGKTEPVSFPPPKEVAVKPAAAPAVPPKDELPPGWYKLQGPLQVQLSEVVTDSTTGKALEKKLKTHDIDVTIMAPSQYVTLEQPEFKPAENGRPNRLSVRAKATDQFSGPPCEVRLVLSADRIPGLKETKTPGSTLSRRLLEKGQTVELVATDLQLTDAASVNGYFTVTVDGYPRAFTYKTTFDRSGITGRPDRVIDPVIGLQGVPRYARPGKLEVGVEVDNAPRARVQIEVGVGRGAAKSLDADQVITLPSARDQRVRFSPAGKDGALVFHVNVVDWRPVLEVPEIYGDCLLRVQMLDDKKIVKVLDGLGDRVDAVVRPVTFDDTPPTDIEFGPFPRNIVRGDLLPVQASGQDRESKIKKVIFFVGQPEKQGDKEARPKAAEFIEGAPANDEGTVWVAKVPLKTEKKGLIDLSVEFVNGVDLSAFKTVKIELVDAPANAAATGSIKGTVTYGERLQPNAKVVLSDAKKEVKDQTTTNDKGEFVFKDVPAGAYNIAASKTDDPQTKGETPVAVEKGKTKEVKLEIMR
jgi:hypothetical protein